MTRRHFLSLIAATFTLAGIGLNGYTCNCDAKEPAAKVAAPPVHGAIEYQRSGGFAGTNDRISVDADGAIRTSGKLLGTREGKLTDEQRRQLVAALAEWNSHKAEYPPPPNTADAFSVKITYGGKSVTATDASEGVPERFLRVREILEGAANELPRKQG